MRRNPAAFALGFPRHAHARNLFVLITSGGGARALQVVAYPVLLFIYTPSAFGLYAGFTMISTIAAALATMRYEWAIPVAKSPKHAAGLFGLCVATSAALAAIMLAGLGIFPRAILSWIGLPGLSPVAWLSAFSMFGISVYGALTYWAIRFSAFPAIARTQVTKVASELFTQLALGLGGLGIWGLAIGNVAGMCTGIASLLRVGGLRARAIQSPTRLYALAKAWRDFPLYSGTAGLLNQAATRVPLVALGAMFSPASLGLLWAAFAMLEAPNSIIVTSAARVFYRRASEIWHANPERLRGLVLRMMGMTFVISLACGVFVFFAVPWLIHAVLPARWAGSSDLVRALIPYYIAELTVTPFMCYGIVRRQRWQLAWNVFYLAANLAVVALGRDSGSDLLTLVTILSLVRFAVIMLIIPIHMRILTPPARIK